MNETGMINTNVEEKRGLNIESVPDMADNMESDAYLAKAAKDPDDSVITEEMLEQEVDRINSMNYIEVMTFKKDLQKQIDDVAQVKAVAEQFMELQKKVNEEEEASAGDQINLENMKDDIGLNAKEIQKFLDGYAANRRTIQEDMERVDARLMEFENVDKTAKFMNECMLEIADKRIKQLEDDTMIALARKKDALTYYQNMRKIYSNRDSVDFVISQIVKKKDLIIRFIRRTNKEIRYNQQLPFNSVSTSATKAFINVFSVKQMTAFDGYLSNLFNPEKNKSDTSTWLVQYALYLVYSDKKLRKYGEHKWIEMLILNVLNIIDDSYDLDNGIEYFDEQLLKVRDTVMEGLPELKVK